LFNTVASEDSAYAVPAEDKCEIFVRRDLDVIATSRLTYDIRCFLEAFYYDLYKAFEVQ
jgi:hypothetical protein